VAGTIPGTAAPVVGETTAARIAPTVRRVCVRPGIDRRAGDDRRVCVRRGTARRVGDDRPGSPRALDRHPAGADRAATRAKFYEIDPRDGFTDNRHNLVFNDETPGRGSHLTLYG
jgi:hypothetical protein